MKASIVCCVSVAVLVVSTSLPARERRLILAAAQLDAAAMNHTLFAGPEDRTEGDGATHYNKAVQALPSNLNQVQIRDWLDAPLDTFPEVDAERLLQRTEESLKQLSLGAECKSCKWPPFAPGTMPANLREYRTLIYLVCLQARLQTARGQFEEALATIQTALGAAKHIGEAPTVVQGNVGLAMAAMTLRCVEDIAQSAGSPNLHAALGDLPDPLVDLEIPIAVELKNLESSRQYNALVRAALRRQMEEAYARLRQMMNRLDGRIAALQCIETLRHYAATHGGQLPAKLGDITDITVPDDPITGRPFLYRREGAGAVLEVAAPQGSRPEDALRYVITVAR